MRTRGIAVTTVLVASVALLLMASSVVGHAADHVIVTSHVSDSPQIGDTQRLGWVSRAIVEAEVAVDTAEACEELCSMGYACPGRGICRLQLDEEQVTVLEESGFIVAVTARGIQLTTRPEQADSARASAALTEFSVSGANWSTVAIPDSPGGTTCGTSAYSNVNITTAPSWATVSKVYYQAAIAHTMYYDLILKLHGGLDFATIWDRNGSASPISGWFLTEFDGLPVDGLWGLVAWDCAHLDIGSITSFQITVYWECDAPGAPGSPSPGDGATNVPLSSNLDWADASGATSYDAYFGTSSPPPYVANVTTSDYFVPYFLQPSTRYYWKIVAKNACSGESSPIWDFDTCSMPGMPDNPLPADGAANIPLDFVLNWPDVSGATSYFVYFGTASSPPFLVETPASHQYVAQLLQPSTHYYWQILARNTCGDTMGPVWDFTTAACSTPGTPGSPSPADNATGVSVNGDLDWGDASGATSYDVYFGTSSPPPLYGNTSNSSYSLPALLYNTRYYWRVVAKNACGNTPGTEWDFTTQQQGCTLPGTPSGPSPANGATNVSVDADLDWADSSGTTSYDIFFGTSSPPPYYDNTTSSARSLPRLEQARHYYWKITAKNSCGDTPGPEWHFSTPGLHYLYLPCIHKH